MLHRGRNILLIDRVVEARLLLQDSLGRPRILRVGLFKLLADILRALLRDLQSLALALQARLSKKLESLLTLMHIIRLNQVVDLDVSVLEGVQLILLAGLFLAF